MKLNSLGSLGSFLITSTNITTARAKAEDWSEPLPADQAPSTNRRQVSKPIKPLPNGKLRPFEPSQPKLKPLDLEINKKQHSLKLNTSHQMIRAMVSLENEQDDLRDKSNFAKSFKRMSAGIKSLESPNKQKYLDTVLENISCYDEKGLKTIAPVIKNPDIKVTDAAADIWMKKHGLEINNTESKSFTSFLKSFFDVLSNDLTGLATANDLIIPLLSLGLSNDAKHIEKALLSIFDEDSIDKITIDLDQFLSLFKGDKKNDIILNILDKNCKDMLKQEQEKKFAQKVAVKRTTRLSTQISITNEKIPKKKYPTIEEFIRLIKKWWAEIVCDSDHTNITKIAEFLAEKGMVSNKHEGRIIIKAIDTSSSFYYNSFEKIFLKSILKASLINVAIFLNDSDYKDFSIKLKLGVSQRRLMIAGTSPRYTSTAKQGRVVLQAMDTYKRRAGYEAEATNNKLTLESAEELNDEKINKALFKLKESANQFLDDHGNVKENIKNVWEIKSSLPDTSQEFSTPKFSQQKYTSVLTDTENLTTNSKTYNRRVKLFRENFLYKEFNKMIDVYPGFK